MPLYESGFYITRPLSNNRFDYEQRDVPSIYVPSLIEWTLDDVRLADTVAIETYVWKKLVAAPWLQHFVYLKNARVPTWICDNHNHVFTFWYDALVKWYISNWSHFIHIDQHTDLATPLSLPMKNKKSQIRRGEWKMNNFENYFETLEEVQNYANTVLTIADFIVPALSTGLISEATMITGETGESSGVFIWDQNQLKKIVSAPQTKKTLIVDLDLDYFSQGFEEKKTFSTVKYWVAQADIITIATSPLFIDQGKALDILKSLQKELLSL